MEITRHFTSTVLIVYRDRVLLHRHRKFNTLLPVGGHVDRDELPEEAALREVQEEAGLAVTLYNPDGATFPDVRLLVRPAHVLLIDINAFHQHIDLIFYAQAATDQLAPADGESAALHWYSRDEILAATMPENVRILALEALDRLASTPTRQPDQRLAFRRRSDGLTYRYHPCEPFHGRPAWQRDDLDLWVLYRDGDGWIGVNAEGEITAVPWGLPISRQGDLPPTGEWVSKKGDKSYVYDLVFNADKEWEHS